MTDKLSPVSDQLGCKAHWALSAVETLESAIAIKKNGTAADTRISVQHLIDCDSTNVGCVGGWPARAWKFFQKTGYVAPEGYPYKQYLGAKRQCLAIKDKSSIKKLD
jgi:cathepsin B